MFRIKVKSLFFATFEKGLNKIGLYYEVYDKIIVFDNGRIKEQGTHDELMKLKKRYYTFHKFSKLG